MTFLPFLLFLKFFCTVSPAGAALTTAPAPVGNTKPTALARRGVARNCFSPPPPPPPPQAIQHPAPLLVVTSSGQDFGTHISRRTMIFQLHISHHFSIGCCCVKLGNNIH
jgi:hypothetical protein